MLIGPKDRDGTRPAADTPGSINPRELTAIGSRAWFVGHDPDHGDELRRGTGSSVQRVKDIFPGPGGSCPTLLANVGGVLYLRAADATSGLEPWCATP